MLMNSLLEARRDPATRTAPDQAVTAAVEMRYPAANASRWTLSASQARRLRRQRRVERAGRRSFDGWTVRMW